MQKNMNHAKKHEFHGINNPGDAGATRSKNELKWEKEVAAGRRERSRGAKENSPSSLFTHSSTNSSTHP